VLVSSLSPVVPSLVGGGGRFRIITSFNKYSLIVFEDYNYNYIYLIFFYPKVDVSPSSPPSINIYLIVFDSEEDASALFDNTIFNQFSLILKWLRKHRGLSPQYI
jgi:hypothetical protein